eukprot:3294086-Amphidinium_carterae.3
MFDDPPAKHAERYAINIASALGLTQRSEQKPLRARDSKFARSLRSTWSMRCCGWRRGWSSHFCGKQDVLAAVFLTYDLCMIPMTVFDIPQSGFVFGMANVLHGSTELQTNPSPVASEIQAVFNQCQFDPSQRLILALTLVALGGWNHTSITLGWDSHVNGIARATTPTPWNSIPNVLQRSASVEVHGLICAKWRMMETLSCAST